MFLYGGLQFLYLFPAILYLLLNLFHSIILFVLYLLLQLFVLPQELLLRFEFLTHFLVLGLEVFDFVGAVAVCILSGGLDVYGSCCCELFLAFVFLLGGRDFFD